MEAHTYSLKTQVQMDKNYSWSTKTTIYHVTQVHLSKIIDELFIFIINTNTIPKIIRRQKSLPV